MIIRKASRETLTAVEMDIDDELQFTLADGRTRRVVLKGTNAWVHTTNLKERLKEQHGGSTVYRFWCEIEIDGVKAQMVREVGSQRSFYVPRELMGLRIWYDACDGIFGKCVTEEHGPCRPRRKARFALQDAARRICPVLLHPWCPLPEGGLRIEDCYNGDDCWLGAYRGASAHGGLDINHPAGTPLWTPIAIDDNWLFDSLAAGHNNNRWRGVHRWPDGSAWILQSHHIIRMLVPEHQPLPAGFRYAEAAGVLTGDHEHSHFVFKVLEPGAKEGEEILLDPWILFWQMYEDRRATAKAGHG